MLLCIIIIDNYFVKLHTCKCMLTEIDNFSRKFVIAKNETKIDEFKVGDTVTVGLKILDGNVARIQDFTGVCIAFRKKGVGTNFIVRKTSGDIGVERAVMLYSPLVAYVKCIRKGSVRRSKLYYIRERSGKAARIREKINNIDNKQSN